ncbi:hypothetical protein B0H19DRAFT_1242920 [Mycena capillaripes]|nr:hypothetical protein B0H19DRAFT_1242920 [Mycena capillaripes]
MRQYSGEDARGVGELGIVRKSAWWWVRSRVRTRRRKRVAAKDTEIRRRWRWECAGERDFAEGVLPKATHQRPSAPRTYRRVLQRLEPAHVGWVNREGGDGVGLTWGACAVGRVKRDIEGTKAMVSRTLTEEQTKRTPEFEKGRGMRRTRKKLLSKGMRTNPARYELYSNRSQMNIGSASNMTQRIEYSDRSRRSRAESQPVYENGGAIRGKKARRKGSLESRKTKKQEALDGYTELEESSLGTAGRGEGPRGDRSRVEGGTRTQRGGDTRAVHHPRGKGQGLVPGHVFASETRSRRRWDVVYGAR